MIRLATLLRPIAASLFAALLLAACVPTAEHPILGKDKAPGADILGAWHGTTNDGTAIELHLLKMEDGTVALLIGHEDKKDGGTSSDSWSVFHIVTAKVKGENYLSALWDLNDGKPAAANEKGYHLLRYTLTADGTLSMFFVDEKKLIEAVKKGKLEGTITGEGAGEEVRVTASSEKLARFVGRQDPKALFAQPFATFKRAS